MNFPERYGELQDLGAIYLLLGTQCNMSCRHCVQTPIKNTLCLKPNGNYPTKEVLGFIKNWANLPWRFSKPRRLYFWGGEPLLFWETIKRLVKEFEECSLEFRIFSNGLLLNQEIVDFCNSHNVRFILSYDAPNATAVRNVAPSKEKCDLYLRIDKRTVNTVFNAINNDMLSAIECLEEKFPSTEVTCGFINVLSDIPKDIWKFKSGDVRRAVEGMYLKALKGDKYALNWFITKLSRTYSFDKQYFSNYPFPPCRPSIVSLSINFKGDVILCHNYDKVVANVRQPFEDILDAHKNAWKESLPSSCLDCEHLDMCRCICPIALRTQDNKELVYCSYLKDMWSAVKDYGERLYPKIQVP